MESRVPPTGNPEERHDVPPDRDQATHHYCPTITIILTKVVKFF